MTPKELALKMHKLFNWTEPRFLEANAVQNVRDLREFLAVDFELIKDIDGALEEMEWVFEMLLASNEVSLPEPMTYGYDFLLESGLSEEFLESRRRANALRKKIQMNNLKPRIWRAL